MDLEEVELKQKLSKLTEKLSDKEKNSDEDFTSDEHEANQHTDDMKLQEKKQPYFSAVLKRKSVTADGSFCRNELSSLQRVRLHDFILYFYFAFTNRHETALQSVYMY